MWFLLATCEFFSALPADPRRPVAVLDPAGVDFCVEYVVCLGLAKQEALDAPSDRLVAYVMLDAGRFSVGVIEVELLVEAVVAAKEREHSVEHGHHFENLVRLVHSIL